MVERARLLFGDDSAITWEIADGERAPTPPGVDWIVSSLCAQWFDDLGAALTRHLIAAPVVAFATLVDGTFAAWVAARRRLGHDAGIRAFVEDASLEPLAHDAGATRVTILRECVPLVYPNALEFLRALRGIGASSARADHRPAALGPLLRVYRDGFVAHHHVAYVVAERSCASS